MSASFDKLKAMLHEKKTLSSEDIQTVVAEQGEMTAEEITWLESEKLKLAKEQSGDTVTMDQYLEACKILDTAAEGSDEYKKAEAIVDKYESQ
jgi:hypothetical protein